MKDFLDFDIVQTRELLKKREVTSAELTSFYLDRIGQHNPEVGAYLRTTEDLAMQMAEDADRRIAAGEDGALLGLGRRGETELHPRDDIDTAGLGGELLRRVCVLAKVQKESQEQCQEHNSAYQPGKGLSAGFSLHRFLWRACSGPIACLSWRHPILLLSDHRQ